MNKELSDMTLEELWELFPIFLTEYNHCWIKWYTEEKILLENLTLPIKINHIGSTAVSGIWAKPIIDILVEAEIKDFEIIKEQLLNHGYICMAQSRKRLDFNKGYTKNGFEKKVFHLHLREFGDHDELYFRDYLREHKEAAKEYERLKILLWKKYEHNRDAYTDGKTKFVKQYTKKAKEQYSL